MGHKTAKYAKLQDMAITVCCISPTMPEEQLRKHRAVHPWSYATRIARLSCLGPRPHGDMVFPTLPKMAKTRRFGQNGPHSRYHTSMTRASNNPSKDAIDTWDLCPNIFLCLWLSGAEFVVHVSAEVWLALGVFEDEERTGIVRLGLPIFLSPLFKSSRGLVAGHKKICQGKDMSNPTCAQLHTA